MNLYIITLHFDEDSVYFTEMTAPQARQMRQLLSARKIKHSISKIRSSPGFHGYQVLMADFLNMA